MNALFRIAQIALAVLAFAGGAYKIFAFDQIGFGTRVLDARRFYERYPRWSLMGKMVLADDSPYTTGGIGLLQDAHGLPSKKCLSCAVMAASWGLLFTYRGFTATGGRSPALNARSVK